MHKVMVALITPFTKENKVDYKALDTIVKRLLKEGVDGFIVCGTTAETPTLSKHEKLMILRHVIKKTGKRAEIWYGCGSNDTNATRRVCKEVQKEDIDGVMLVTPYYNRPSQEGLYAHFHEIASAIDTSIMLYNVPSRTGVNMSCDTILRLLQEHTNITSLKQASHNIDDVQEIKKKYPNFLVYSGEDGYFDEGFDSGMDGIISVMGHIFLPQMKAFIDDERRSLPLLKQLYTAASYTFMESSPASIKYMLYKRVECENILRLPMTPLSKEGVKQLEQWLTQTDK